MKAAHNGVPSLSVLDGWWREGWVDDVTGWAVGPWERPGTDGDADDADARDLHAALDDVVLSRFAGDAGRWAAVMRSTIAVNASFFNAQRMLQEYFVLAYEGIPARPGLGLAPPSAPGEPPIGSRRPIGLGCRPGAAPQIARRREPPARRAEARSHR
jgi:hypothetical protein